MSETPETTPTGAKPSLRERMRRIASPPAWVAIGVLSILCAALSVGLATADDGGRGSDRGPDAHMMLPGEPPEGFDPGELPPLPPDGRPPSGEMPPPMNGNPPAMPPSTGEVPQGQGNGNNSQQDG